MQNSRKSFDASLVHFVYRSPYGLLTIQATNSAVTCVKFGEVELSGPRKPNPLTNLMSNQLMEYFAGKRQIFDVPLDPDGTDFQKKVWAEIMKIPYGQCASTSDIAARLGDASSYRVVGAAAKRSPLAVVIPTHRISAAEGRKLNATKANVFNAALLKAERHALGLE